MFRPIKHSRTPWILNIILALILALGAIPVAYADVYVDAANTSGIEDGTTIYPYAVIQRGLNIARAGETVWVEPGVYYGAIEMKDSVRLVSTSGAANTIIDGMGAMIVISSPYSTSVTSPVSYIEGFTVRNGTYLIEIVNRMRFWGSSTFKVVDCVLRDAMNAIKIYPAASVEITASRIEHVDTAVDAIWCKPVVAKNLTVDHVGQAFSLYQMSVVLYNTEVSRSDYVIALWGHDGSGVVYGANNNYCDCTSLAQPTDRGRYPWFHWSGTMNVDPLYVDADNDDLRLAGGSPLIDAGVETGLPYDGLAPDIGCYEHNTTAAEYLGILASSVGDVNASAFKNADEQRRDSLHNKIVSALKCWQGIDAETNPHAAAGKLGACLNKLDEITAKADGCYGGKSHDDWITDCGDQETVMKITSALAAQMKEEIAALLGN